MICEKCGKEILNFEKECPYCGHVMGTETNKEEAPTEEQKVVTQTVEYQNIGETPYTKPMTTESKVLGILAIVFSALGGCLGLILAIVGLSTYKEEENRKLCKIAIVVFVVVFILSFILGFLMGLSGMTV